MNTFRELSCVVVFIVAAFVAGCSGPKSDPVYADLPGASASPALSGPTESSPPPAAAEPSEAEKPELIVTPDDTLTGSVVSVNEVGRFAVLTFPLGSMPAEGSTLFAYRQGLKVGELKVTGPQKDDHTVADIKSGECRTKDEVRDR
jgi:hypothetical protein